MAREYFEEEESNNANHNNNNRQAVSNNNEEDVSHSPSTEHFGNASINVDLILKSVFWAAIFYLLCLPDVHKMTANLIGKKVDLNLIHAVVYALLYFIISQFI